MGRRPTLSVLVLAQLWALAPAPAAASDDVLTKGVLAAAAADLATTQWAFASIPGARDANPLIQGPGSAAAVKIGMAAGVLLLDRELQRRGNRKAAKVLKVATIVAWGSCAAWNLHQLRRGGGR